MAAGLRLLFLRVAENSSDLSVVAVGFGNLERCFYLESTTSNGHQAAPKDLIP
jgi:hypothetical protein